MPRANHNKYNIYPFETKRDSKADNADQNGFPVCQVFLSITIRTAAIIATDATLTASRNVEKIFEASHLRKQGD